MTKEQMRQAIAEALGFKLITCSCGIVGGIADGKHHHELPNWPEDLNACHEMEKALTKREWWVYRSELDTMSWGIATRHYAWQGDSIHASAEQRCIAFLKTKGLWKEDAQ